MSEDIAGLGIWLVGYPAPKTNWGGIALALPDRADNVLARLLVEPRLANGNVIFVVHSLGGLVVEQLLRSADRDAESNGRAQDFLARVRRIAFLGTPHRGAILANLAVALRMLLLRPSAATRDLLLGSPQLKDLNRWYRKKSQASGIEHLLLAEGRPERVLGINLHETFGKVVWSDSADPGLPELPITVDESHTTICKPDSRETDVYVLLKEFIARPFAVPRLARMAEALESNTSQLRQLTTQSQEQTLALEAVKRTVEARSLVPAMDTAIVDAEVARQTERLRRCRFFAGVNTIEDARRLTVSLDNGVLALASSATKGEALAWCARFLATTAPDEAQSALDRITSPSQELISIARAFIKQGSGNLADSLGLLAAIDMPMARGAAYICVQKTKGFEEAETWLQHAGLTGADLDSDAKLFRLGSALDAGSWDIAYELVTALTTADFERTPAILRFAADAYLIQAVPDELRMLPRQYIPSNAATFPLRSEPDSLGHRRRAVELYERLASVAAELGMSVSAGDASDRALWLRLRDPEHEASARSEMTASLRDPTVLLRRLNLAVQFGIEIDLPQVEKEVDRQTALSGGTSPDAAVARFSLAFVQGSHAAAASYVDKHRAQLLDHLEWKGVYFFEIETLAKSGQVAQAEVLLREAIGKGITPNEEDRLRRLLEEVAGNDPIGGRLATYEKSRSIVDLRLLVDAYEGTRNWAKTAEYGKSLLALTGDIADAHRYAVALYNQERLEEVLAVFAEYADLSVRYDQARLLYARTLCEQGRLNEARLALDALRQTADSAGARQLQVSLAVTSGDWESLQGFVESEWSNRVERAPTELLRAGQIAQLIGVARGRDLVREAAQRAAGDSATLLGCYHAAVSAGWEESREVFQWFEQSAALSEQAGDGLVQRFSIEDIVERKPAWDKREADAWSLLTKGEIPQFTFGRILNRSLLNLFLLPALSNVDEPDVRRRPIVHALSGARASAAFDPSVIAMDPTSLITAELLGVLGLYISTFDRIVIPHNTLGWLLDEKARILFHQPSRVAAARELRQMIADRHLRAFDGTSSAPEGLINEVGESLAALIAEASDPIHSDKRQRLVVRGGPIHRVSTFMKEEADLAGYMPCLCSAVDVVDKLAQKGILTAKEADEARDALRLREAPWPSRPDIADGAVLYLDDITVSHLEFLGLLQKLHRAGVTAVVPQSEIEEANALIRHDASSAAVIKVVDGLRSNLKNGLESGKVHLGRAIRVDDEDSPRGALAHPSVAMLRLIDNADAGVSDDRFLNQHLSIASETSTKPLLTTVDLLDSLQRRGALSAAKVLEARTALRRANYALMPLSHKELSEFISSAPVVNGALVETAELRIVRENVQRIRMSDLLQFPKELPWLNTVLGVSMLVLKEQWTGDLDEAAACARSDWLLKLGDVRGWTHRLNEGAQQLEDRYLNWVALLMMLAVTQSQAVKEAYWRWFGSRILNPIADEDHKAYGLLLERAKAIVDQGVDFSADELEAGNES
ncbi:CDC27 family protein [Roseateles violae]|uniref:CDC27 family protein n=1 Tax=Roseateles violae TaxID=3058042 RepID=A0ABT8DXX4_9BURK|nr:CDC27 family protein [Pelomonas sp. PFR6]MDN3922515.1 CDC27 family protein [Pelomonas sp. PFR6]